MDNQFEEDNGDGEVSISSRTRSGVTFASPLTRSKNASASEIRKRRNEGPDDSIVVIESSSSAVATGGTSVTPERRASRRNLSEMHQVSATVHRDQSTSASEVESLSEASDQEEHYQTCPSDVEQSQVRAKRRSVQPKVREAIRESAKKSDVAALESRCQVLESGRSTRMLPQVRLGMYRGESCLETFLVKFEDISSYMRWTEEDRLFHLRASLDGVAGQILWDAGPQTSTASVIRLLRARFGNEHQAERFRAELRSRRRQKGESLQKLYNDVCRLLALACPGPANATSTIVGRDAFIDSLGNQTLRVRILERKPKTIEDALNVASRLEAYDRPISEFYDDEEQSKGRGRQLRQVTDRRDVDHVVNEDMEHLKKQLENMRTRLEQCESSNRKLKSECEQLTSRKVSTSVLVDQPQLSMEPPVNSSGYGNRSARRPHQNTSQCFVCGEIGHWRNECPNRPSYGATGNDVRMNAISASARPAEIYVDARIHGKHVVCLLDTGCEHTIVGRKLLPNNSHVFNTDLKLFAANGTPIPLCGAASLKFTIDGYPMTVKAVVTDALEELILGVDWLSANKCIWDFGSATLRCQDKTLKIHRRTQRGFVRRIYAAEEIIIPAGHQRDVPVKMALGGLQEPLANWLLEPKLVAKGIVVARMLMSGQATKSAVRVINMTESVQRLRVGQYVGSAEPVETSPEASTTLKVVTSSPSSTQASGKSINAVPEHLRDMVDSLPVDLSEAERVAVIKFVVGNADTFSRSEFDLGRTNLVKHRIDTGDHRPFKQPLRRHPIAYLPMIDEHVENMLRHDIIEPAASPWSSNVVLIQKPRGQGLRFCVDYRMLNQLTYKDSYPLPRIDTCLQSIGKAKYFSTVDLRSSYWQTEIDERDRDKSTFVTRRGTFRFKVLSFGLSNAPALFQRLMDLVLSGLTWEVCLVYLDDVIVFSDTFEQHLERLTMVFDRLKAADLKVNGTKTHLFQHRVSFLGHVVSEAGIEPDPEKIEAVRTWPRPSNLTELRSFVGLASYYRDHIRSFASIARPLHILTRKGARFEWAEEQEMAFSQLKDLLTSAPVLAAPMDSGTFILDADASNGALGIVLQQEQDGKERVIAYASRSLDNAERSYCTTRKELLAVIFGLKKYRQFLLARSFVIRTDHSALTQLLRTPEPLAQQARWIDLLAEFNFEIRHRPGLVHGNSDALSRRPCEREGEGDCRQCHSSSSKRGRVGRVRTRRETLREQVGMAQQSSAVEYPVGPVVTTTSSESAANIRQEQLADEIIGFILRCREQSEDQPEWSLVADRSDEVRTYRAQWASLTIYDGMLYRRFYAGDGSTKYMQLIVPPSMREAIVRQAHGGITGGHFGIRRTTDQVLRRAYWCGWRRFVENFCRQCNVCNQVHRGPPPRQALLQPLRENGPMDRLHIDLCGPFPRSKGYCYILTCIDAFTRFLIATPLPDKSAITVAEALVKEVFCKLGCSRQLVSDLGTEFQNEVIQQLCHMLEINQLRTTSYRPATNGRNERVHRSLNSLMAKLVSDSQRNWVQHLPACVMAYNVSKHESTSYSPYFLMHGREAICPLDMVVNTPFADVPSNRNQYADELVERLKDAFRLVHAHTGAQAERMKRNYDANVRTAKFEVEQLVWYYYPRRYQGRSPKWSRFYTGPFRIEQRLNDVNFIIKKTPSSKGIVVHVDKLRAYYGPTPACWRSSVSKQ